MRVPACVCECAAVCHCEMPGCVLYVLMRVHVCARACVLKVVAVDIKVSLLK